jgi:hypothetical protein
LRRLTGTQLRDAMNRRGVLPSGLSLKSSPYVQSPIAMSIGGDMPLAAPDVPGGVDTAVVASARRLVRLAVTTTAIGHGLGLQRFPHNNAYGAARATESKYCP